MAESQVTMTISTFKRVALALPPWTSVLLRANHGVGKSQVIRQVIKLLRKKYAEAKVVDMSSYKDMKEFLKVTDRRLSQVTEGDIIGLPSTDGACTRFNPPDWFKEACTYPVALFLDELNRATPEVMQAAFQIVLDRELNGWKLHPETRVYAAINNSTIYTVNEMDPALLDRFFVVDLAPTIDEFCAWARNTDPDEGGNLDPMIPDFIQSQTTHDGDSWLYPPKKATPGGVHPSPRSWEMFNRAKTYAKVEHDDELFYPMCAGFLGIECAIKFKAYCHDNDNRITGEEIINSYQDPKVQAKIKRLGQGSQNEIVAKVATYVVNNLKTVTDQQGQNIAALATDLPDELRIVLWSKLAAKGIEKIELTKSLHKYLAPIVVTGVFNVPMGDAGIGVTPNIPGIFKPKDKT